MVDAEAVAVVESLSEVAAAVVSAAAVVLSLVDVHPLGKHARAVSRERCESRETRSEMDPLEVNLTALERRLWRTWEGGRGGGREGGREAGK